LMFGKLKTDWKLAVAAETHSHLVPSFGPPPNDTSRRWPRCGLRVQLHLTRVFLQLTSTGGRLRVRRYLVAGLSKHVIPEVKTAVWMVPT
jgi:hypothetical protein